MTDCVIANHSDWWVAGRMSCDVQLGGVYMYLDLEAASVDLGVLELWVHHGDSLGIEAMPWPIAGRVSQGLG